MLFMTFMMFMMLMVLHAYILHGHACIYFGVSRILVHWWSGSEKDYGGLTSREGHILRGTEDMGKSVT